MYRSLKTLIIDISHLFKAIFTELGNSSRLRCCPLFSFFMIPFTTSMMSPLWSFPACWTLSSSLLFMISDFCKSSLGLLAIIPKRGLVWLFLKYLQGFNAGYQLSFGEMKSLCFKVTVLAFMMEIKQSSDADVQMWPKSPGSFSGSGSCFVPRMFKFY